MLMDLQFYFYLLESKKRNLTLQSLQDHTPLEGVLSSNKSINYSHMQFINFDKNQQEYRRHR